MDMGTDGLSGGIGMTQTRQARGFYATAADLSTPDGWKDLSQVTGVINKAL